MLDRRFAALNIEVNGWKDARKVSETWGDFSRKTRVELLSDVKASSESG